MTHELLPSTILVRFNGHDLRFRKLMDSSRRNALGWTPKTDLLEGLALTYRDFQKGRAI